VPAERLRSALAAVASDTHHSGGSASVMVAMSTTPARDSRTTAATSALRGEPTHASAHHLLSPIDAPCTQRLRHGDPIHARKGLTLTAAAVRAAR
jgi:hypothetical protein